MGTLVVVAGRPLRSLKTILHSASKPEDNGGVQKRLVGSVDLYTNVLYTVYHILSTIYLAT